MLACLTDKRGTKEAPADRRKLEAEADAIQGKVSFCAERLRKLQFCFGRGCVESGDLVICPAFRPEVADGGYVEGVDRGQATLFPIGWTIRRCG